MYRKNKYGNKKTIVDGIMFDSKKEAEHYKDLRLLERAGRIGKLQLQPEFTFVLDGQPLRYVDSKRVIKYRADFQYTDMRTGRVVIEDVKGMKTPEYKLKKAMMFAINKIILHEV